MAAPFGQLGFGTGAGPNYNAFLSDYGEAGSHGPLNDIPDEGSPRKLKDNEKNIGKSQLNSTIDPFEKVESSENQKEKNDKNKNGLI